MSTHPEIAARLVTDNKGQPMFVESGGKKHYKVEFEVQNVPQGAYTATFELHPNYFDPRRTLTPDSEGKFRLSTTAYGDYDVKVWLRTKDGEYPIIGSLGKALQSSRQSMAGGPAVDEAIAYISSH